MSTKNPGEAGTHMGAEMEICHDVPGIPETKKRRRPGIFPAACGAFLFPAAPLFRLRPSS